MPTIEDILMVKGPDVIVASPETSVAEATAMMSRANVGSIVIKDDGVVAGIFTERDLLKRVVAAGKDPTTPLSDVMSSPVRSCSLDDSVVNIATELRGAHIRHMAVIEDDALVGLVGLRDVMASELVDRDERIRGLEGKLLLCSCGEGR